MPCGVARGSLLAALEACEEERAPGADETRPLVPFVLAAGGRDMLISRGGAADSSPPNGEVGWPPDSPTAPAAPPPPLVPPGATGGVPFCSGDADGAGLPTLGTPAEPWVGCGVGAGDGAAVELGAVG